MGSEAAGRFAPSPTGPLHAGSLVAALASWLDARAQGGRWLVRMEDTDSARTVTGMGDHILWQLQTLGLVPDGPVLWQSTRHTAYRQALDTLIAQGDAYPCACTRKNIETALAEQGIQPRRHVERVYPGTCRTGLGGRMPRVWRFNTATLDDPAHLKWRDRRLGEQQQNVAVQVGDFVLRRAEGDWAYQLAVVVDDAFQGITHVVRGEDLADNTPRQRMLQQRLGLAAPQYLHTPLVLAPDGQKLSKQNQAEALNLDQPVHALQAAAKALALPQLEAARAQSWLAAMVSHWAARWMA
jgi:glutamyl-Q tRNA(Asp) synthetase